MSDVQARIDALQKRRMELVLKGPGPRYSTRRARRSEIYSIDAKLRELRAQLASEGES